MGPTTNVIFPNEYYDHSVIVILRSVSTMILSLWVTDDIVSITIELALHLQS